MIYLSGQVIEKDLLDPKYTKIDDVDTPNRTIFRYSER